jgi:hypothetical protein
MKKMFLALAAASLVSTMAFAQDDYDYGDDYGTEASTSSDDGYTDMDSGDKPAEQPASDVEYKSMDDKDKKVSRDEGTKPAFFDKPFNMAGHIGFGYGSFWSVPEQYDNKAWRDAMQVDANPYDEWLGIGVSFGIAFNYRFTELLSASPEFNFGVRGFFRTLDSYYDWWYGTVVNIDENLFMFDIEIPLLLRVMPTHQFYLEAGPQLSVKLTSQHSISYSDASTGEELESYGDGSWDCSTFFAALVLGGGATLDIDGKLFDLGLRFIMDMTKLQKDDSDMLDLDGSTFKDETKMWVIQIVVKYWF